MALDYDSILIVRSKLRYLSHMKNAYMLQKQVRQYDDNYDLPMVNCVNGHSFVFGRHEFCLMTGFRFGILSFRKWRSGDIPFRDRVFSDKVGQYVKNIDLLSVIEDDDVFLNLSDDAIRVCLLLTLEGEYIWRQLYDSIRNVASKNRVDNSATLAITKSKDVPTYCLSRFVSEFKIWIIETSAKSQQWRTKDDRVIPRALSWSKHRAFGKFDNFDQIFDKESTPKLALTATSIEAESHRYTESLEFFRWYTLRSPPVVKGGPYDDYWKKRASGTQKFSQVDSSVEVAKDVEVFALEAVVKDLVSRTLKLETIIQVLTSKIQKVEKDSNEKVYNGKREWQTYEKFYTYKPENQDNYPIKSDAEKSLCIEVESPDKDGLHNGSLGNVVNDEKQEDLCQPNEAKFKSSPLKQLPHERYGPKKRRFEKVLHRPYANLDRIYVCYEIDRFLLRDGWRNCKFPWCGEITVDRTFWDALIGLDDKSKGWLRDELKIHNFSFGTLWYFELPHVNLFLNVPKCNGHIDLWIAYMWHTRPDDKDWSMVSCFSLPLLMQGSIPLFYANKEKYPLGWADVERVFIPINEPETHWSLVVFHIRTGNVTFYDTQGYPQPETRLFYLRMRETLETRLLEVLKAEDVFDQLGIDPVSYRIKFMNAEDVPRQGGLFDDCGVWVCILLFRLGNDRPLEFDNPIQTALAYRERLIKFYYKHKIHVP
ncbi:phospholipase-like, Aminotransferase-like mobile domain protein [Artemisia annua]|uniref:Phospholipase-like, Aminotransferase-like mobile domain protein n=1 Tax=Artemisia annua TaxID=35608 RepID=A0A2U1Q5K1_ARTAN|nr:phospholipase-like, Aminotransferase-like mobile domain protein [Artemisia annua]